MFEPSTRHKLTFFPASRILNIFSVSSAEISAIVFHMCRRARIRPLVPLARAIFIRSQSNNVYKGGFESKLLSCLPSKRAQSDPATRTGHNICLAPFVQWKSLPPFASFQKMMTLNIPRYTSAPSLSVIYGIRLSVSNI